MRFLNSIITMWPLPCGSIRCCRGNLLQLTVKATYKRIKIAGIVCSAEKSLPNIFMLGVYRILFLNCLPAMHIRNLTITSGSIFVVVRLLYKTFEFSTISINGKPYEV